MDKYLYSFIICLSILFFSCKKGYEPVTNSTPISALKIYFRISNNELNKDTLKYAEGDTIELVIKKTNTDSKNLRYTILNNNLFGASINPKTGNFKWVPDYTMGLPGNGMEYEFIFAVTDSASFLSRRVTFLIVNKNQVPYATFYRSRALYVSSNAGKTKTFFQLIAAYDSDKDGINWILKDVNGGTLVEYISGIESQRIVDSVLATGASIKLYRRDMQGDDMNAFDYNLLLTDTKDTSQYNIHCVPN